MCSSDHGAQQHGHSNVGMHNVFFSQSKAAHKASSMSTNLKGKVLTGKLLLRSQAGEVQENDAMCIEDMLYIEAFDDVKKK